MVRSLSTSRRAHSRRFAVSALATSIALALGSAHAQTVSATSVPITGRAPVVTIASITNQTVPGQAPAVGHVLHANALVVDPDNDAIVDTLYRWKRGGTEVGTGVDYTATAADAGQTLTLEVEATTNSASTDPDRGSATSTVNVVGNSAPTATPTITFDGPLDVDTVLTGSPGYADTENDPQGVHTYQWYRADDASRTNQVAISGATNSTYTVTSADRGKFIVLGVVPRATVGPAQGSEGFATTTIGVPVAATAPEARVPQVAGNLRNGSALTASFDYFDNELDPQGVHKYQWFYDDGTNETNIENATGKFYELTAADQGDHYIGVRITPVSTVAPTDGTPVEVRTSEKFSAVAPTASPTITYDGVLKVGTVMTAHSGFNDANNDTESGTTYQFCEQYAGGVGIHECFTPSTNNTYTVTAAQETRSFIVQVIPRSDSALLPEGAMVSSARTPDVAVSNVKPEARTPSISGTLKTGNTLTAAFEYFDNDSDPQGEHKYQWFRDNGSGPVDIPLATNKDYVLTSADQGDHYIGVRITPVSTIAPTDGLSVEVRTTEKFIGSAPTATPTITFEGTFGIGTVLTGNVGYLDAQDDPQGAHTYQWYRADDAAGTNAVAIGSATAATYTVVAADAGKHVIFEVVPKSSAGTPSAGTATKSTGTDAVPAAPAAPEARTPSVSVNGGGVPRTGSTLRAEYTFFDANNDLEDTSETGTQFQWYRHKPGYYATPIAGATGREYVLTGADQGTHYILVQITPRAVNAPVSGTTVDAQTSSYFGGTAPTATPTITYEGAFAAGTVLTGNVGYADAQNDPQGVHTYQWYRATDAAGTNRTAITDATNATYTLQAADGDSYIVFEVTPKSDGGLNSTGTTARVVSTDKLAGTKPEARTPSVSVSGDGIMRTGSTLRAEYAFHDAELDDEDTSATGTQYQWYRHQPGGYLTNISGATNREYTLTAADQGDHFIGVYITPKSMHTPTDGTRVEAETSAKFTGSAPTATPTITFEGAFGIGTVLTGNVGYLDAQDDPQGVHTYQWYRADDAAGTNAVAIGSATNATYTVVAADAGKHVIFEVVPRSSAGTPSAGTATRSTGTDAVPAAAAKPEARNRSVSGNLLSGSTLRAEYEFYDINNDAEDTTATGTRYQWFRHKPGAYIQEIPDATGREYVVKPGDQGDHFLGVYITPYSVNAPFDGTRVEVQTLTKFTGSAPTASPTITYEGAFAVGTVLTGNVGYNDAQNDPQGVHTYQWYRATDAAGTNRTAITNATNATYTLQAADGDRYIVFEVTPKSDGGLNSTGTTARVVSTDKLAGTKPEARNYSVSGNVATGGTLRAEYEFFDAELDDEDTSATGTQYQWYRHKPGAYIQNISDATGREYTLTAADQGDHFIGVYITPKSMHTPTDGTRVDIDAPTKFTGVAPTATPTITFDGVLGVGTVLTAHSGYLDGNNDAELGTTYQWCSYDSTGDTFIGCATASTTATWTVAASNEGQRLTVKVIPKSGAGTPNTGVSAESAKTAMIPHAAAKPEARNRSVSGNLLSGSTLRAEYEFYDINNDAEDTTATGTRYQWFRHNPGGYIQEIPDATGREYVVKPGDQGDHFLGVYITPYSVNAPFDGTRVEVQTLTKFTGSAPYIEEGSVNISGSTWNVGSTVTGNYAYKDNENDPKDDAGTTFAWYISDESGGNPTLISGATSNTYVLRGTDQGGVNKTLWFRVTGLKSTGGTPNAGTPSPAHQWQGFRVGEIKGSKPTATPTITGTTQVGSTLTANPGYNDVDNDTQAGTTYEWCAWEADGTMLVGCAAPSTSNTWVLPAGNANKQLSVTVIPRSSTGNPKVGDAVQSAKTAVIGSGGPITRGLWTGNVTAPAYQDTFFDFNLTSPFPLNGKVKITTGAATVCGAELIAPDGARIPIHRTGGESQCTAGMLEWAVSAAWAESENLASKTAGTWRIAFMPFNTSNTVTRVEIIW